MKSKWSGDGRYHLPAQQVEPYRLWFEYLKLAMTDPDLTVNRKFYRPWGDVEGQTFDEWWGGETWRKLFALDNSVRILERSETLPDSDPSIVVRLPLGREPKHILADVESLLREHGASSKLTKTPQGRFALSDKWHTAFIKYLRPMRRYVRMYGLWLKYSDLEKNRRIEQVVMDYYDWATARNKKIRERDWKYEKADVPQCFDLWIQYLRYDTGAGTHTRRKITQDAVNRTYTAKDGNLSTAKTARIQVMKQKRSMLMIAESVASGVFPGKY